VRTVAALQEQPMPFGSVLRRDAPVKRAPDLQPLDLQRESEAEQLLDGELRDRPHLFVLRLLHGRRARAPLPRPRLLFPSPPRVHLPPPYRIGAMDTGVYAGVGAIFAAIVSLAQTTGG
jgi:hypothetical protein